MSIQAYQGELDRAKSSRERSLADPNGVIYMNQLSDLVEDNTDYLDVVLRTDQTVYDDLPVTAYWSYGRHDWQPVDHPKSSALVFGVHREIVRHIQSKHASEIARRFFGQDKHVQLDVPFLPAYNSARFIRNWGSQTQHEEITSHWDKLRTAIQLTADTPAGYLNGQRVTVMSPTTMGPREAAAPTRLQHDRLEIYLDESVVNDITALWSQAFRREVLLDETV